MDVLRELIYGQFVSILFNQIAFLNEIRAALGVGVMLKDSVVLISFGMVEGEADLVMEASQLQLESTGQFADDCFFA